MRPPSRPTVLALALSSLAACAADEPADRDEEDPLADVLDVGGKADGFNYPTDFGALFTATWQYGALWPSESLRYPAWTFALDAAAEVTLTTRQAPGEEVVLDDTILYLYRQRDDGRYRRVARAGDGGEGRFAALTRTLDAGVYRVIAKAPRRAAEGEFMVRLDCAGEGCRPAAEQCVLGEGASFYELRQARHGAVTIGGREVLTSAAGLSDAAAAQIVAAVQVSELGPVTTALEAFAAVDGGEVNRFRAWDSLAGRSLVAFEYGAGDSSYGAFFVEDGAATPVAEIQDGGIEACALPPRSCVFGRQYREAAFMPDMEVTASRVLAAPADVGGGVLERQVIAATRESSHEPTTLAEAFAAVDEGRFNLTSYRHADGRRFVSIEYGAGDNSYGAFFTVRGRAPVASIHDGDLYGCAAY